MDTPILEIENLTKSFGAVSVLTGVSFTLSGGTILGLAGENGAGKSTLARCIRGDHKPTSGKVKVNGSCYVIPQEFTLIPELKVYENIFLGRERVKCGILQKKSMQKTAAELLKRVDCPCIPGCRDRNFERR